MPSYNSTARRPFASGGKVSKKTTMKEFSKGKRLLKGIRLKGGKSFIEEYRRRLNQKAEGGWITKKKKTNPWITKKEKPKAWITKKKKELSSGLGQIPEKELPKRPKAWITKKQRSEPRDEQNIKRAGYRGGGRTNLLEELGRVEAEPSNRNRRAEVSRIHGELNRGYARGGKVSSTKKKPYHDKTTLHKSQRHPHSRLKTQKEYKTITDSSAYKKADYHTKNKMLKKHPTTMKKGGRAGYYGGGRTRLLEELGRVEAEPSNRNRRAEISRVHGELNKGYKSGGAVLKGKKVGIQIK